MYKALLLAYSSVARLFFIDVHNSWPNSKLSSFNLLRAFAALSTVSMPCENIHFIIVARKKFGRQNKHVGIMERVMIGIQKKLMKDKSCAMICS